MRRTRTRLADDPADRADPATTDRRRIFANGWPVLPLRLFLAALFLFAGYAKFSYPRFFDPDSRNGFKSAVDAAKDGDTPLSGVMGPLSDHASLFGHLTAYAEIAIGLGLLVGLLTRLAALGGMILTAMIVLSINWNGVKEYTGSSGWFTSVELALIAALSVFLLGGAGPLALDNLFIRAKERQRARDDAEPSFRDSDIDDSRRRLQGEPGAGYGQPGAGYGQPVSREPAYGEPTYRDTGSGGTGAGTATAQLPTSHTPPAEQRTADQRTADQRTAEQRTPDQRTAEQRTPDQRTAQPAGYRTSQQDEEYRDDPEPEPNSLWTQGRRTPEQQPTAEPRPSEPSGPGER